MADKKMNAKKSVLGNKKELVLSTFFTCTLIALNYAIAQSSVQVHCNPGIAFGIILPQAFFLLVWGAVMLLVTFLLIAGTGEDLPQKRLGLWLIICGGIANMADRVIHGCVIDYITIVSWNSFNLADSAIFIGAVLVVLFSREKTEKVDTNEIREDN